jgi:hypothetical protein
LISFAEPEGGDDGEASPTRLHQTGWYEELEYPAQKNEEISISAEALL